MTHPLYPLAVHDLLPEANKQEKIRPRSGVMHQFGFNGDAAAVRRHFARSDIGLECHLVNPFEGPMIQLMPLDVRADAQNKGNAFNLDGIRWGCVSIEHQDAARSTFTQSQIDNDVAFLRWMREEWAVPIERIRTWDGPGWGHHRLFPQWNPNNHSCINVERADQLWYEILPAALVSAEPVPVFPGIDMRATDALSAPNGGAWVADLHGKVECFHHAPYYGDYTTLPAEVRNVPRICIGIDPKGQGYELVMAESGTEFRRYAFGPGA